MTSTTTLALVVIGAVASGICLLAFLSILPATAIAARGLWPTMISAIVVVLVVLLIVLLGGMVLTLGIGALAARCAWEAVMVGGRPRDTGLAPRVHAAALALAAIMAAALGARGAFYGALLAAASLGSLALRGDIGWRSSLIILVFPSLPLVAFAGVAARTDGDSVLILSFVLVEILDSFAVLGGRLWGRHKAFSRLSPHKTIEGLVCGLTALALATSVIGSLVTDWSSARIVLVTVVVAACGVVGDLIASGIKRRSGVKDYPIVHATQGGVLDVVDAWIVAAPGLALVLASG